MLTLVTGNKNKLREAKAILGSDFPIETADYDLVEIQGTQEEIITAKITEAVNHFKKPVIVEDVSLCFDALHGMPGPYIKWFISSLGPQGLHDMLAGFENKKATVVCAIAYCGGVGEKPYIAYGKVQGTIVSPRGGNGFGFDPIFQPDGQTETYAELADGKKNSISHRGRAYTALKEYFKENNIVF